MSFVKGQSSIEFFIYFSITLLVFSILYVEVVDRQISNFEYRDSGLGVSVAEKYGFELENAMAAGDGYERDFELPREVFGSDYNVTAVNGSVKADWDRGYVIVSSSYSGEEVEIRSDEGPFRVINDGEVRVEPR